MNKKFIKGFETLNQEVVIEDLPVQGSLPIWLNGALLRNGPAMFEIGGQSFRHWFDGMAMLHRFGFADGHVSYANKFLQSTAYKGNLASGKISYSEFATDPCRSIFKRVQSVFSPPPAGHNTNVNLTKLAGQFLAMTETPLPVAFDAETLETVGVVDFQDDIGFGATTAHPHYDPARQVGVNQMVQYGRKSSYNILFIDQQLKRRIVGSIPTTEPGYLHSFGMTKNYVILAEFPLLVNPLKLLMSGKPFIENFAWKPEQGASFLWCGRMTAAWNALCTATPFSPSTTSTPLSKTATSSWIFAPTMTMPWSKNCTSTSCAARTVEPLASPNSAATAYPPRGKPPLTNAYPTSQSNCRASTLVRWTAAPTNTPMVPATAETNPAIF